MAADLVAAAPDPAAGVGRPEDTGRREGTGRPEDAGAAAVTFNWPAESLLVPVAALRAGR